jgi:hypothetical protein
MIITIIKSFLPIWLYYHPHNYQVTNSQTPRVQIPAAALKRFANDLAENINIATNKNNFLKLNHQRKNL